jgi:hypothetical protein
MIMAATLAQALASSLYSDVIEYVDQITIVARLALFLYATQ